MKLEDDILIEKYLRGTLSKDELSVISERIKNDDDFKKKVAFEKQLFETLNDDDWSFMEGEEAPEATLYEKIYKSDAVKKVKETIQQENQKYQNRKRTLFKRKFFYMGAAVIALLISIYLFSPKPPYSSEKLYTQYIESTDLPSLVTREQGENVLAKGQSFFEAKAYEKAIPIFKNRLELDNNATVYLYLGISQMELNRFSEAEKTFNSLINSNLLDAPKGKWFKALLYLKMKKIKKSKLLLEEIITTKSYNFQQAQELLEKLP